MTTPVCDQQTTSDASIGRALSTPVWVPLFGTHARMRPAGDWQGLVVVHGSTSWDDSPLGSHFLAEALAARVPVLYVDPPVPIQQMSNPERPRLATVRLHIIGDRLARLSPLAPPGMTKIGLRRVTERLLNRAVRQATRALPTEDVRAVVSGRAIYDPFGVGERRRIFRASDDFVAGASLAGLSRRALERRVRRMAARADVVVCVSPVLRDLWRERGADARLIPNGCAVERLSVARDLPRPAEVDLAPPVLGYIGRLADRIDLDLLDACVDAGYSLLLVGGRSRGLPRQNASRLDTLVAHPRVRHVGAKPFEELPAYLGAMDVGLVPYRESAFNRASFPLKMLDYLGAGLPVVTTDLPAARWLAADPRDVVIASAREFSAAAGRVLDAGDGIGPRRRRQAFAARHSWAHRADQYLALI